MADTPEPKPEGRKPKAVHPESRWRTLLRRSHEPPFLLGRSRVVLFVNRAWEELTGLPLAEARELVCRRVRPGAPDRTWKEVLEYLLCPPPEVLEGNPARVRRLLSGAEARRRWWDVDFFPL